MPEIIFRKIRPLKMSEVNENLKSFKIIWQIGTMIYGWLSDKSKK
jgi:hypothetical protein